jgi:primosomal protein N' (replication factor Y)
MPSRCPSCGSARIRYLGGGTERVVDAFADGRLDVLVGTSLVTKGLDIPAVTLVGIVSADVALNLPDERAAERTYQLLAQAVGRAGRGDRAGRAIIQTYQPDHAAIVAVAEARAEAFYDAELDLRRRFGSPPYGRLVKLTAALPDRGEAEGVARELAVALRDRAATSSQRVTVSGPAPAFVARRGDRWRFNVVLRGDDPVALLGDPPGQPWSIDVDPETLL